MKTRLRVCSSWALTSAKIPYLKFHKPPPPPHPLKIWKKPCGCVAETGDTETIVIHLCFCEEEYPVPEGRLEILYEL